MQPKFRITNAITGDLTRIERARGFLEAARLSEDWIAGMQQRALILEAHHTTHIEGTHLSLDQSERLLSGEKPAGVKADDAKEVINYRKAFDLVADYLGSGDPITGGLIREINKRLVRGVRGNAAAPGEYRRVQNYVANSVTKEIIYTPPPPQEASIYDRDCANYYRAIQSVRAQDLDLTKWLEYFTLGLKWQLSEVQKKGETLIRLDVLAKKHKLSGRQRAALELAVEKGEFQIQDMEVRYPDVHRRTLQRDLHGLVEKRILTAEGSTNRLVYHAFGNA